MARFLEELASGGRERVLALDIEDARRELGQHLPGTAGGTA